jgi:hypothetical protein
VVEVNEGKQASEGVKSYAVNPALARRLWDITEEMVGERFAPE